MVVVTSPAQRSFSGTSAVNNSRAYATSAIEIEIEKNDPPGAHLAQVRDDVAHRLLQRPRTPGRRHDAELALEDAPAGRFDGVADVHHAALVEIAPGERQALEFQSGTLIVAALHAAGDEVLQQPRPRFLGISDDDAVGMVDGFLGDQRRVHAAEDHRDVPVPESPRQLVRARRGSGNDGDADQIGVNRVWIDVVHALVEQRDIGRNLRRDQGCQRRQRQRRVAHRPLPDAAAMTVERTARAEKRNP